MFLTGLQLDEGEVYFKVESRPKGFKKINSQDNELGIKKVSVGVREGIYGNTEKFLFFSEDEIGSLIWQQKLEEQFQGSNIISKVEKKGSEIVYWLQKDSK